MLCKRAAGSNFMQKSSKKHLFTVQGELSSQLFVLRAQWTGIVAYSFTCDESSLLYNCHRLVDHAVGLLSFVDEGSLNHLQANVLLVPS